MTRIILHKNLYVSLYFKDKEKQRNMAVTFDIGTLPENERP